MIVEEYMNGTFRNIDINIHLKIQQHVNSIITNIFFLLIETDNHH